METKSTIVISNDDRQFGKKKKKKFWKNGLIKLSFEWMHHKTHNIYKKNGYYTIPVIISTITGTANFAQERNLKIISLYVMVIGTLIYLQEF